LKLHSMSPFNVIVQLVPLPRAPNARAERQDAARG
jgi:hypothetical protein